jgi:MFS family permease
MPGGMLAHRYGGKRPMGLGLLLAGVATVLTPMAARSHKYFLCAARVLCGLGEGLILIAIGLFFINYNHLQKYVGFAFPCMHGILANWAVPDEKSKLASIVYAGVLIKILNNLYFVLKFVIFFVGAQFGTALTMIMSGYILHGGWLGGWPGIFYFTGGLTILWFILWTLFVYDQPNEHPRISSEELSFIQNGIGNQTSKVKKMTSIYFQVNGQTCSYFCNLHR